MSYRAKTELELSDLGDEQLIAQLVAARENGENKQAQTAQAIFANRRIDELVWRAKMRLGDMQDAEDIAQEAMLGAIKANFKGESVGEAVRLMHTIVDRRLADFYRSREGKETQPLPEDLGDEDWHAPPAAIEQDETGAMHIQGLIDAECAKLSESHRAVIDLRVFQGYKSKEVAETVNQRFPDLETPMSDQNVDQIASRYRDAMRRALGDEE
ncbi:hypothetical protein BH10ACT11_BH10ACT11_15930 [soil metagenome]